MKKSPGKMMLLVVVLSVTSLVFGLGAATPALADIARAFPNESRESIQMIVTLPSLMIMVATLICGQLSRVMRKKTLVLIGMLLFGIGGVTPAVWGGLKFILVMRGILGAGCGFLVPLSQSLIADFFQGSDRDRYMGYRSSTASIFGIFFTMAGGYLCAIHWRFTFYAHLLVVPVFFLILFAMPEPEIHRQAEKREKAALTPATWFYVSMYFLYNLVMMCFITNVAFVMSESNVGNARTIGFITALQSIGGITAGFLLGTLTKTLRNFTIVVALGFLAFAFVILNFIGSALMFSIACALWGYGFGTFNPAMALKIIGSVPKTATTLGLALLTCAMGVGQFLSPYFYSLTNRLLGLEGVRASWAVAAVCFVAAFVIVFLKQALKPRRTAVAEGV
jgi:predicted MFS family arabinose efflux permease